MKHVYFGTLLGLIYKFELPSPQEVEEDYKKHPMDVPKAKKVDCKKIIEEDEQEQEADFVYQIDILYRITGIV